MTENFIREFDQLDGENIMGIYGANHVMEKKFTWNSETVTSMLMDLRKHYGDIIHVEQLKIKINGLKSFTINKKEYKVTYLGKQELNGFNNYSYREYWRVEDAYDDVKDIFKDGQVVPYNNYPVSIVKGEVFLIIYTFKNGAQNVVLYRSDGNTWNNMMVTEVFRFTN
jgi:hypothetical protein